MLALPEDFRQHFEHRVLGAVRVHQALRERSMDSSDAGRPVGGDLLAQGEMQAHVEEGVLAPTVGGVVGGEGVGTGLEQGDVLGMLGDDGGDLCLERLEGLAGGVFAPGVEVHLAQLLAVLAGEDGHYSAAVL